MTFSTELIVLSTTKLGEKSLVVHCLTPSLGRRSFIASVPSGGGMALFLPLNILEGEVSENPRSDLWRVRRLSAVSPLGGIRSSVSKNTMTLFMSEVLYRTVRDGAMEEGLFDWCKRSVLTLDAMQGDFSNFHLRFFWSLPSRLASPRRSPTSLRLPESISPRSAPCLRVISDSSCSFRSTGWPATR